MNRSALMLLLFGIVTISFQRAAAQQHANVEKGFKPDQAYAFNDIDVVNLFNGNLNVNIPIGGKYPVGGTLSYAFSIAYAGNNWDYDELTTEVSTGKLPPDPVSEEGIIRWAVPYRPQNAGMGWVFTLGRLISTPRSTGAVYQAPDGSEHEFVGDVVNERADGTHIRLTPVFSGGSIQRRDLEFPDGTVREFDTTGRLQKIRDRPDNRVDITYYENAQFASAAGVPVSSSVCGSSYLAWKVADPHRTHYVYFLPPTVSFEERICQASLAAFNGQTAKYLFSYSSRVISRQRVASREAYRPEDRPSPVLEVPLLTKIELPYGSSYEMVYDAGMYRNGSVPDIGVASSSTLIPNEMSDMNAGVTPGGYSGHLIELRIPSKGRYEWTYQRFAFPPTFGEPFEWDLHPAERWHPTESAAVWKRKRYVTATPDTWTYSIRYLTDDFIRSARVTKVEGPDGSSTESYFSIYRQEYEDSRDYDYGAPYTPQDDLDVENPRNGMFLSSRTTIPEGGERLSYVFYEWDQSAPRERINNRRLKSRLTVFEDGRELSEEYDDYDGFGNYRKTTIKDGDVVKRTIRKNFNPTPPQAWILDRYDSVVISDSDPAGEARLFSPDDWHAAPQTLRP